MDIILVMLAGMVAGHFFFPKSLKKVNEKIQLLCTLCLIFSMGVMLGRKENFLQELTSMGIVSFCFSDPHCALHPTGLLSDQAFLKKNNSFYIKER